MSHERTPAAVWVLGVVAAVVVLLGSYAGSYFWLAENGDPSIAYNGPFIIERVYPNRTLVAFYRPAGKVEAWWRGTHVDVYARGDRTFK